MIWHFPVTQKPASTLPASLCCAWMLSGHIKINEVNIHSVNSGISVSPPTASFYSFSRRGWGSRQFSSLIFPNPVITTCLFMPCQVWFLHGWEKNHQKLSSSSLVTTRCINIWKRCLIWAQIWPQVPAQTPPGSACRRFLPTTKRIPKIIAIFKSKL